MTNEDCRQFCSSNNYGLAGTEAGTICYCGNALQSYSALGQQGCNSACSGNSSEICGGSNGASKYISVWNATSNVPATTVHQVGTYVSQGCYSDSSGNNSTHSLNGANYTSNSGMTVEACVGFCQSKKYGYAGVEYGQDCYCDSSLASVAQKQSDSQCNMLCTGNEREFCGAYGDLIVYKQDSSSVSSDGTPSTMGDDNTASIQANTTAPASN